MASGIVAGISKLLILNYRAEDVIIAVCDQPFVSAKLFQQLSKKKAETGKSIVACAYEDTIGTPVLFGSSFFEALLQLSGQEGAKKLLKFYEADVATIPFPQGSTDIDTTEDYENLLNNPQ